MEWPMAPGGFKLPARLVVFGIWLSVLGVLILYFGTHLVRITRTPTFGPQPVTNPIEVTVTHGAYIVYHTGLLAGAVGGLLVVLGGIVLLTDHR